MNGNRLIRDDLADVTTAEAEHETAPAPRKRRSIGRGPYAGRRQVTAHIDQQLFKWLKTIHVQTGKPMVELMNEALSEYVQRYAAQKKFSRKAADIE